LILPEPGQSGQSLVLAIHDADMRKRLRIIFDMSQGYRSRGGHEFPAAGWKIVHPEE
jgi:hypothetical protein